MLPDHRLAVLLDNSKRNQVDRCLYHTTDESPSLCVDHSCDRSRFPSEVLVELTSAGLETSRRPDEVWQVRFSPDGKRLASCGTDETVSIWDIEHLVRLHRLHGHDNHGVGNVAWAPDSRLLVSCGVDHTAKLWDTDVSDQPPMKEKRASPWALTMTLQTGECLRVLDGFDEPVSSCVWAADQTFITGSFDKNNSICQWNVHGECVYAWPKLHRTEDLALSRDQRWLIAIDERCNLHVYNFATQELVYDLSFEVRATSVSISRDSRYILVHKADKEAVLIDIETRETVRKYMGQATGQYTIRADFGGANENFVISGSEGEKISRIRLPKTTAMTDS